MSAQVDLDFEEQLILDICGDGTDEHPGFYADPLGYVRYVFPWGEEGELDEFEGPDEWQTKVLEEIGRHIREEPLGIIRIAVKSGHNTGKTALVAWLINWATDTRPRLNGTVTANTFPQLTGKTWREVSLWHSRKINKHWNKWTASRYFSLDDPSTTAVTPIANNENNSEAFAGQHGRHSLLIYDEASAIPDIIWEVSSGVKDPRTIWLVFGNPTRNSGRFYECWGRFRHRWKTFTVNSLDCRLPDKKEIQNDIDDYGEDSDFVRVRWKGEFPRASSSQFIPKDIVEAAMVRELEARIFYHYPKYLGVDVAKGGGAGNNSVIIRRQGPKVWQPRFWDTKDIMEFAGYVMEEYQQWQPVKVFVDGVGVGAGLVHRLKQLGVPVVDVVSSRQANNSRQYSNIRAEMWGAMKEWLEGEVDIPEMKALRDDLINIEYGYTDRMQVQLEKKQDMEKRGLSSPDFADSLALTFASFMADVARAKHRRVTVRSGAGWT